MTNANFPRGFQPIDDKGVEIVNFSGPVDASNTTSIGAGDGVVFNGGNIIRMDETSSTDIIGTANQFRDENGQISLLIPPNTAGEVLYVPALGQRYKIQTNGTDVVDATVVGALCNIAAPVDADTTTGQSKMEIDTSSITAAPHSGSGTQLVIEGKAEESEWGEPNVRLIVSFNNYQGNTGT